MSDTGGVGGRRRVDPFVQRDAKRRPHERATPPKMNAPDVAMANAPNRPHLEEAPTSRVRVRIESFPSNAPEIRARGVRVRIDRRNTAIETVRSAPREGVSAHAPGPSEKASAGTVLVVMELNDQGPSLYHRELLGAARRFAGLRGMVVVALAFALSAEQAASTALGPLGADRIIWMVGDGFALHAPEAMVAHVRETAEGLNAAHVIFDDTTPGGGDIGRRLAARTRWSSCGAVVHFSATEIVRRAEGGSSDWVGPPARILMFAADVGELSTRHQEVPIEIKSVVATGSQLTHSRPFQPDPETVGLDEADFIVGAGNGVTDWTAFASVAEALGAARGGSRVVVDNGHLPRHRQVGVSGTLVEPSCYIAFGIAGASQHLEGIRKCERVIAVNTDLHADMVKRADLAIIQDAQPVMIALAALATRRRDLG